MGELSVNTICKHHRHLPMIKFQDTQQNKQKRFSSNLNLKGPEKHCKRV